MKIHLSILVITVAFIGDINAFSYNMRDTDGPTKWGAISSNCEGKQQSPINIDFDQVENGNFESPLKILRFNDPANSVTVINSGHSFSVQFKYQDGRPAQIVGGPLKGSYNIVDTHFHWGINDLRGSEHSFNGQRFAAEGHIVSYNSKYQSLEQAKKNVDGLAVLAVMFQWSDEYDNQIFNLTSNIVVAHTNFTTSEPLSMFDLVGDMNLKHDSGVFHILSYKGSLTTPGCNEVVTWLVSIRPIGISSTDLKLLRSLNDDKGKKMMNNYRPMQKMNGRMVTFQ